MDRLLLQSWLNHEEEIKNPQQALEMLVGVLGDPDPEIRDTLGYTIFTQLLAKTMWPKGVLSHTLSLLANDEHAMLDLGEKDAPSILRRSFSWLAIAALLERDALDNAPDINQSLLHGTVTQLNQYLSQEQDWTGYHPNWGWVHAGAHTADAAAALARHPNVSLQDQRRLALMAGQFIVQPLVWNHEEMDRWAWVWFSLIERHPDSSVMDDIFQLLSVHQENRRGVQNVKAVLYPLYFLVRWSRTLSEHYRDLWLDRLERLIAMHDIFVAAGLTDGPTKI